MTKTETPPDHIRTLRLRLKDRHAAVLREKAQAVNFVWNYCNELSFKTWQRHRRFMRAFDFQPYTKGASKELGLHSQTVQAVQEIYAEKRATARRTRLRWRVSKGARRSLGWIPFKASALNYRNGQLHFSGIDKPLSLWDSYGLTNYTLGPGSLSEDSRGRWYLNVTVKLKKGVMITRDKAIGLDLGLKEFAAGSDGTRVEAQRFYRDLEDRLATAQRARKRDRVRALHDKIKNRRRDALHKLSTALVNTYGAIFVGDVNASALARTRMAKSVLDAGWSTFRTMLEYKCHRAGIVFREVSEAHSTQTCSVCHSRSGPRGLEGLGMRAWCCTHCGTPHDRDVNAARNILSRGLAALKEPSMLPVGHDRLAGGIP